MGIWNYLDSLQAEYNKKALRAQVFFLPEYTEPFEKSVERKMVCELIRLRGIRKVCDDVLAYHFEVTSLNPGRTKKTISQILVTLMEDYLKGLNAPNYYPLVRMARLDMDDSISHQYAILQVACNAYGNTLIQEWVQNDESKKSK